MSYISISAKGNNIDSSLRIKFRKATRDAKIERNGTSFSGGCGLTKQQFADGMSLAVKMRGIKSW